MNWYALSVLCFGTTSILIGLLIWIKLESKVGFYYFLFSCAAGLWGIFEGQQFSNRFDYDTTLFLGRCSNSAAIFIGPAWYHFTLIFSKQPYTIVKRIILGLFYGVSFYILSFSFTDLFIPSAIEIVGIKYYVQAGPLYNIFTCLFFITVVMGFTELFFLYNKTSGREKNQCLWLILATGAGFLGGALTFPPVYGIPLPQYGLVLMPIYPLFMAISMMKYGLLTDENLIIAAHKDKLAALGILTASINHEIRGPLFAMRGTAETEQNIDQMRVKLLNQIDRLTAIVSRLTHFAKKGVDEAAKIEPLDLKEIIADVRPLLQHQFSYQSIQYEQNIPNNLPKVMADRRYLEEILFNLLINACQALRETPNPKIELKCFARDSGLVLHDSSNHKPRKTNHVIADSILIEISDNGPGIPPDQIKHIFKPFHTSKAEGTGLGLYITKQLVEKCGGKIEVESELNQGAKFTVIFAKAGIL